MALVAALEHIELGDGPDEQADRWHRLLEDLTNAEYAIPDDLLPHVQAVQDMIDGPWP